MLKLLIYEEGRDFELPAGASAFRDCRKPIQLLAAGSADPGFRLTADPDEADFIVFPYNLECIVYPERALAAGYFIRALPYYHTHESRHVFFNFHDLNQPLATEALVVTDDPDRFNRGDPHLATFPHAPGSHVAAAAPCFSFRSIAYDTNYVGTLSDPVRITMAESVQHTEGLSFYIRHPNTLNWEDRKTSYLHMDDGPEKAELARLYVEKMRQSWTTLCARGMGSSSIRFYETLCMGRIPVHVSDAYILPKADEIDYASFCLLLPEAEAPRTGEILRDWLAGKSLEERAAMCIKAREVWERHFRPELMQRYALSLLERRKAELDGRRAKPQPRYAFGRSELLSESAPKPYYKPGGFDAVAVDDRRLWLVKGMAVGRDASGAATVNGLPTRLAPGELLLLTAFAAEQDVNAVLVCPDASGAAEIIALANGLFHGRKLNAAIHVAVEGDGAALRRDLDAAGAGLCVRLHPLNEGETPALFLQRFRPGSVHAVLLENAATELGAGGASRLRADGVVLRRNRLGKGFVMEPASPFRAGERLFATAGMATPSQGRLRPGDLVLAMAQRGQWEEVAPLVRALREEGFAGEVVIFAIEAAGGKHKPGQLVRQAVAHGCCAVTARPLPNYGLIAADCLRHFLFRTFLAQYGAIFQRVLLAEPDAGLSADAFARAEPDRLSVFATGKAIGDDAACAQWLPYLYGADACRDLEFLPGARAGLVLGETQLVLQYLQAMTEELLPAHALVLGRGAPAPFMAGADAAAHNYLLRRGFTPPFLLREARADAPHALAETGAQAG